jgi:hypothetical protein
MSKRKKRPAFGDLVSPDVSLRDAAAALGISKSELHRFVQLGALEESVFEARLAHYLGSLDLMHVRLDATKMLRDPSELVPARGRVKRALQLFCSMTGVERKAFMAAASVVMSETE